MRKCAGNNVSDAVALEGLSNVELPDRMTPAMRETIRHARCLYRGVSISIEALADQVARQVSGHVTIPEDQEYRYALKLGAVGKELSAHSRRMLELYTGYDASTVDALGEASADALSDARIALYGCPFD